MEVTIRDRPKLELPNGWLDAVLQGKIVLVKCADALEAQVLADDLWANVGSKMLGTWRYLHARRIIGCEFSKGEVRFYHE